MCQQPQYQLTSKRIFCFHPLCFVKTSEVGYWKRMMVMHEDVCNHWLGAGCWEEIRNRVPSVSPCHTPCAFSNKISRQKEMFCQCQWEIQFQRRKKSNYFVGERTKTSVQTKATTNALPLWMQWPVFPTSNMSIGAIQNMTNRPWLKQAYNGLFSACNQMLSSVAKISNISGTPFVPLWLHGQRPQTNLTLLEGLQLSLY